MSKKKFKKEKTTVSSRMEDFETLRMGRSGRRYSTPEAPMDQIQIVSVITDLANLVDDGKLDEAKALADRSHNVLTTLIKEISENKASDTCIAMGRKLLIASSVFHRNDPRKRDILSGKEYHTLKSTLPKLPKPETFQTLAPKKGAAAPARTRGIPDAMIAQNRAMAMKIEGAKEGFNEAVESIDRMRSLVKTGKYEEAQKEYEEHSNIISGLIKSFREEEDKSRFEEPVGSLLAVAKSFHEYDTKERHILTDADYDGLVAAYIAAGFTEPGDIVPDTKATKKTSVKYERLHNTMNKAYVMAAGDPLPPGVEETQTVEGFLSGIFKTLGLNPHTDKLELELSPKVDGVSVNGTVKSDTLIAPQTRGDSSSSMSVIGMDGLKVGNGAQDSGTFGIQYEAFVTDENRIKVSEFMQRKSEYASDRHAAAGLINRLCTSKADDLLPFISLYPIEAEGLTGTYAERMDYLQNFAILPEDTPKRVTISGNRDELMRSIQMKFEELEAARSNLSFMIDGMVITVVKDEYQKVLGRKGRTNQYQLALKFNPSSALAKVSGIHLDSGRKGYRTVQVDLEEPVFLGGARYDHVPVLSARLYNELGLRNGTQVQVVRVGDVIPSIVVVSEGDGTSLRLPGTCPDCGGKLLIKNQKLFCESPNCPGNLKGKILGFFDAIHLEGYSDSFVDSILQKFPINGIGDLLMLDPDSMRDCGMTDKPSTLFQGRLIDAIEASWDYEILGGLGITDIGPARAKSILRILGGWDGLMKALDDAGLISMYLSPVIPNLVKGGFKDVGPFINDLFNKNRQGTAYWALKNLAPHVKRITTDFSKKTRVGHTGGSLSQETVDLIDSIGYEITDGQAFDILITANKESTSSKMGIAQKKNLPVYTETEFVNKYSRN